MNVQAQFAPLVLLIDDDPAVLTVLEALLQQGGFRSVSVGSAQKALDLLDTLPFDVILSDVKMPGMDGIETLREIKKKKPLVEVIMLTGHASVESGIQGMQLGAFDYVMKPVALDELLEKVRQAYDRKVIQAGKA